MNELLKKIPKIGMRNIKTALSVFLCIVVADSFNYITPFYACIASVMSMRDTPESSWNYGKSRMRGTLIGGIFGLLALFINDRFFEGTFFNVIIAVGIILCIYFCNILGKKDSVGICCIVFLAVTINHSLESEKYFYAVTRIIETFLGIIIAVVVNKFVFPYRKQE